MTNEQRADQTQNVFLLLEHIWKPNLERLNAGVTGITLNAFAYPTFHMVRQTPTGVDRFDYTPTKEGDI